MCYAKPGPRCVGSLKSAQKGLRARLAIAQESGDEARVESIEKELHQVEQAYLLTPEGISRLKAGVEKGEVSVLNYEHYVEERKRLIELSKARAAAKVLSRKATGQALNSPMVYTGANPPWLSHMPSGPFGARPDILDVIDTPAGPMAVVWEEESVSPGDAFPQETLGMYLHKLSYVNMETGEQEGYIRIKHADEDSLRRAYGSDEWQALRYQSAHGGTRIFKPEAQQVLEDSGASSEQLLEATKSVWATAHQGLRAIPHGYKKNYYQITQDDAPDEKQIDRDLAALSEEIREDRVEPFLQDNNMPTIDYSQMGDNLRGLGFAQSLYVYSARKMAERGKAMRSSTIQSGSALRFWSSMVKNKDIPVKKGKHRWHHQDEDEAAMVLILDFRNKEQPAR